MSNQTGNDAQQEQPNSGGGVAKQSELNYFGWIMQTIKNPNSILTQEYKGFHTFGLINIIVFLALIALSSIVGRMTIYGEFDWYFGEFFDHFRGPIAYAIALAILLPTFKWYAEKQGNNLTLNYFLEKFGAIFAVPAVLIIISILLELVNIQIYSWFYSVAFTFMYIGIFLTSYLFVSRHHLQVASVFVFGFYFVYRILLLVFN